MKTITEFSGILLERAAEAQRAFRAANPQPVAPAVEAAPPLAETAQPAGEGEQTDATEAVQEEPPAAAEVIVEGDSGEAAAAQPTSTDEPASTDTPAVVDEQAALPDLGTGPEAEAVGAALGVEGERLTRLMEALDVAGRRSGQVRLVRVLQGENPPQGAHKRGDFYYAVDLAPRPQSQYSDARDGRDGDRRRGPGGRDRGGRSGGPGGPGGPRGPGGARGAGGPPGRGGKFSNDRPFGRDGDSREARGETPRAGAGWMLTRAPEDRRGRVDETGVERRDRRPPRGPRFDDRGPRPPMGDRPPRGPRPDGQGARPGSFRPRPEGGSGRPPAFARPEGPRPGPVGLQDGNRGRGPGRPGGDNGRVRDDRNWSGRRRGGWDEPAAPEAPAVVTEAALAPEAPPAIETPPSPAPQAGDAVQADGNGTPPSSEE